MARRASVKDAASRSADAISSSSTFDDIVSGRTKDAKDAKNVQDAHTENVRLNLKVPADVKNYLYEAALRESTPTRRVSATAYLVELVRRDMDKHSTDGRGPDGE